MIIIIILIISSWIHLWKVSTYIHSVGENLEPHSWSCVLEWNVEFIHRLLADSLGFFFFLWCMTKSWPRYGPTVQSFGKVFLGDIFRGKPKGCASLSASVMRNATPGPHTDHRLGLTACQTAEIDDALAAMELHHIRRTMKQWGIMSHYWAWLMMFYQHCSLQLSSRKVYMIS